MSGGVMDSTGKPRHAGSTPAASTNELDRARDERLRREATRILIRNHICNCKRCECESGKK